MSRHAGLLTLALLLTLPSAARAQPRPPMATTQGLADTVRGGHVVQRGDSGVAVRELQTLLARHGHAVAVDDDFGPNTEAAVKAFQRGAGLHDDGLVGPNTVAALERAPRASGGLVGALGGGQAARPPSSSTDPAAAYDASLPWARAAHAAGRHTLIIVFEGQLAYAPGYARRIYDYQERLRAGESPSRPIHSGLSFVSTGLIVPNLPRSHRVADLLILPETSENGDRSIAEEAARAWKAVHGDALKVHVVGHSLGGYAAIRCGDKLARHGIEIASMLTMDARTYTANYRYFIKPRNVVGTHANFFQKGLLFPGYEIQGAHNQRLSTNHAQIPAAPEVVAFYRAMLR